MSAEQLPADLSLLSLCAILRDFDHDLLSALDQGDSLGIAALISTDWAQPANAPGLYHLRDDIQALVLTQLRDERPGHELLLHERCFTVFLERMLQPVNAESRLFAEERCFYHLESLRLPLIERRDWQRLRQLVDAARDAHPQQARHLQRLSLYDSLVAIHTQNYEAGDSSIIKPGMALGAAFKLPD